MAELIFFFLAVSLCVFSILAVTSRQIFHCALWLAQALLSIAGIYFYLDAQFLGVIQVLVYVGGIITLFVFAIKLTASISDASIKQTNAQVIPSMIVALILLFLISRIIISSPWISVAPAAAILSLKGLGNSLMTGYVLPFEFISLLLLAVLVGAIVIGRAFK